MFVAVCFVLAIQNILFYLFSTLGWFVSLLADTEFDKCFMKQKQTKYKN